MPAFSTPEPITAAFTTAGARVRIAASDRPDTVVLVEPVDPANAADVRVAGSTTVELTGGRLSVTTTRSGRREGSVAVTVELPAGSGLVLSTAWTDVHADGPLGDCELDVASGQVELDRVAALRANLAGGELAIGHVAGTAGIDGGSSAVRIGEVAGEVHYQGSTGEIRIGHARSDVTFTGAGGRFDVDRADGDVTAEAANCPIRVGRMTRGRAALTNASGGIEVGIGEGVATRVDATSTKGTVCNSLPATDPTGSTVTVHARTRRDDIVIHPAAA